MRSRREVVQQVGRHADRVAPEQAVKQAGGASRAQERSIRTELVQVLDATQVAQDAREGIQLDATKS
jgi:hypothetical protein